MNDLFIKVENGNIIDHPVLKENLIQVFGCIPQNYQAFLKADSPVIGVYQNYNGVTYEFGEHGCIEVHHVSDMSLDEKIQKQNEVKEQWRQNEGFASWVFNDDFCVFEAPVEYPDDGEIYSWDEETTNWIKVTS